MNRFLINDDTDSDDGFTNATNASLAHQRSSNRTQVYGEGYLNEEESAEIKASRAREMARKMATSLFVKGMQSEDESKSHYLEKFMKRDENSELYLDAVKKDAPLDQLFKVVQDCYQDQNLPICPLLVEVIHKDLITLYGGKYLIQVWNNKGCMIYQRPL